MVAQYYFHMESVPRTVNREDWYKTWREVRIQRKLNAKYIKEGNEWFRLNHVNMSPKVKKDYMDGMINPPLILGPYMDRQW